MIKPSHMRRRQRIFPSLKELMTKVLAAMPLRINLRQPEGDKHTFKRTPCTPSSEALHITKLVEGQDIGDEIDATTDHAWLVVLGYFAQALELVSELVKVPIQQRKGARDC